ncbi:hypothetical protein TEQG_04362 [Trichophyton equinum CBS 127.97]|uniref:Uncharacterized protein n=1 Tax=Trichophyton equinum (strain ATCC MYA-4606 / CBS 127.97) TaxID=559882 RepID=F2PTI6_TRIEC|nr:hypothetical protein TEQG_04362 [Trichophyton equinum CBS 127.97]
MCILVRLRCVEIEEAKDEEAKDEDEKKKKKKKKKKKRRRQGRGQRERGRQRQYWPKRRTRRRMGRTGLQTLAADSEYAAARKAREPRALQSPLCRNTPRCRKPTEPCPGDRSIKTDDIPQAGAPGTGRNGTKKNVAVSLGRMMVRSLISPIIPRWRTNHRRYHTVYRASRQPQRYTTWSWHIYNDQAPGTR